MLWFSWADKVDLVVVTGWQLKAGNGLRSNGDIDVAEEFIAERWVGCHVDKVDIDGGRISVD